MALLVKTRIGPSKIAGIGLFADEFMPEGTKVWEFTPNFDTAFEDIDRFPPLLREFLTTYCYRHRGRYVFCADHAKFFNHADEPSCRDDADSTYAARDIHPGEELTSDYRSFGVTQEDLEFNYREFTAPSHPPRSPRTRWSIVCPGCGETYTQDRRPEAGSPWICSPCGLELGTLAGRDVWPG
jgi:hypothetical protein